MRCRSGYGCDRDATQRQYWCDEHAAQLDKVAAQMGMLSGPQADRVHARWALDLAGAVWSGDARKLPDVIGVSHTNAGYRKALKIAEKNSWITLNGRWRPGEKCPPGFDAGAAPPEPQAQPAAQRGNRAERVKQLGKLLAERGTVTRAEAAEALGIAPDSGSWPRIIQQAEEEGLASPGYGYIEPGPKLPNAPRRDGVRIGRAGFVPRKVVEQIASYRDDGLTLKAVVERLNADGVATPSGRGGWHTSTLRLVATAEAA